MKTVQSFFWCLFLFLTFSVVRSSGQCLTAPVAACSAGPSAVDGETLNAGTTKWYNGAGIFGDYKLNGGTLIICGDLTIDRFMMDSGTVFIQSGSRLVIGNGIGSGLVLRGNSAIYNSGTLEIMRNLSLENGWTSSAKPNVVINVLLTSVLKMQNQYFVINNTHSWFVNKGTAYFHGLITDPQASAGSVCLGTASETKMTVLYNKVRNSYVAPEGSACVHVSEFTQLWDTLTQYPQVNMCLGAGHRTDSSCRPFGCKPLAWGKANLFRGCSSCATIQLVPVARFISFYVTRSGNKNRLQWELEGSSPGGIFTAERSADNRNYQPVNSITLNSAYPGTDYATEDPHPLPGVNYYRIRYQEPGATEEAFSRTIRTESENATGTGLWPNPVKEQAMIFIPVKGTARVIISGIDGKVILDYTLVAGGSIQTLNFPHSMSAGLYVATIIAGNEVYRQKFVKQ